MAIKIQGSTIIDDSRNIVNSGIATLNYQGVAEVTIGSTSVGIGSTNIFTITPQVTQTAIGVGGSEILRLSNNITNQNIFSVLDSGSSPLFTVTTSGDVGIGTTNPSQKLHVDGNFLVSDGNTTVLSALSGSSSNILSVKKQSSNPAFDITGIGSVGIGTTQPSGVFEVSSGSNSLLSVKDTALAAGANIFQILDFDSNAVLGVTTVGVGIGSTNIFTITPQVTQTAIGIGTDELITLAPNSGSDNIFQVTNSSGSTKHFVVTNNGNIGVGTTNPSRKLHVDGDFLVSDGSTEVLEVNGSAGNPLSIQSNSLSPAFDVTGIGSVGIGTTQPSAIFEVVSGGSEVFRISDAPSDNYLEIDTDKFVVNSSGNAGIGTTNPQAKLDVNGGLIVSGVSTLGTVQISSGIVTASSGIVTYYGDGSGLTNLPAAAAAGSDGQVQYNNGGAVGGASALYYDDVNNRVGVGTTNPQTTLHVVDEFLVSTAGAASSQRITQRAYTLDNGSLSWEGSAGQLFSITNNLTSGSIFSVNDVSGLPSIDVDADGTIQLAPLSTTEYVGVGKTNPTAKLDVSGNVLVSGNLGIGTTNPSGAADPNNTTILNAGIVTANFYYGNGSGLTNLPAAAAAGSDGQVQYNNGGAVGGASALYYDDVNNRVGIGTTNPEYDLDIGGSVNAADPENAGVGTVRIAAQLGIGHTDLTRATAKPTSTYGGVLTLGGDYSTGDNPIIIFDAYPASSSFNNILIGDHNTGRLLSGDTGNVLIGGAAGNGLTGNTNIAIGAQAMNHSITGSNNYGIGYRTLFDGSGDGNVAFGAYAGNSFGSGGASYNIFLGYHAGYNIGEAPATGDYDYNIIIGAAGAGSEGFFAPKGGDKQLAIGGHRSGEDPFYWIVGDENENIGIGTTNPSGAADPNNTTILNAGIVTANFYYGDGSGLTNLVSPSSNGEFYTGVSSSVQISPLSFETSVFTFPSTAGKQYVIESINVANVDTSVGVGTTINIIASIEDSTGEQTYIAYNIPIVNGGLVDLLKNPIVAGPSDVIKMWTTNYNYIGVSNAADVYMNYTEFTSTEYISEYASTVSIATTDRTAIYTSSTYPTTIESIHLTNRTDSGDYPVSITITNGVTTTYLAKDLILPRYSVVDILDRPKRIETNATIDIEVGSTSTIDVIIAGKQITS